MARLAGFFGAVALLLSAVGLYGVISHTVARRRGEIVIRLALGARGADIVRLMLTSIGMCVLAGTVVGLLAAVWLSRFVAPLLYRPRRGRPGHSRGRRSHARVGGRACGLEAGVPCGAD